MNFIFCTCAGKIPFLVCHYRNTFSVFWIITKTFFLIKLYKKSKISSKNIFRTKNFFSSCTESESIDQLNELNRGVDDGEEEEEKVAGSDEEPDTTPTAPGSVEYDENASLGNEEAAVQDDCRGDDKFRCGKTSTFICEVEKCDGVSNCPNGEDEVDCPTHESDEGSGEENIDEGLFDVEEVPILGSEESTSHEPENQPRGDFFIIFMSFPFNFPFFQVFLLIFIV